jgi:hypothetical protein
MFERARIRESEQMSHLQDLFFGGEEGWMFAILSIS